MLLLLFLSQNYHLPLEKKSHLYLGFYVEIILLTTGMFADT